MKSSSIPLNDMSELLIGTCRRIERPETIWLLVLHVVDRLSQLVTYVTGVRWQQEVDAMI